MRVLVFLLALTAPFTLQAEKGGPAWWWRCKKGDLIIRGKVTYDSNRFYQIIPPSGGKIGNDHYYVCGTVKIEQVLYANPDSQHSDSYRHYMRNVGQEFEILLRAQRVLFTCMKQDDLHLDPTVSGAFIPDASIFSLDVIYMFPFGGLVLNSSVPKDKEEEAINLIRKRDRNLSNITTSN